MYLNYNTISGLYAATYADPCLILHPPQEIADFLRDVEAKRPACLLVPDVQAALDALCDGSILEWLDQETVELAYDVLRAARNEG